MFGIVEEENVMTEKVKAEEKKIEASSETQTNAPSAPVEAPAKKSGAHADKASMKLEGKMVEFVDWIETISVLELSRLVKVLEERLGVSAAAPAAMVAGGAGGASQGADRPAAEVQTEFKVVLTDFGAQKIQVIKEVRVITGLGLKESKELVEGVPRPVKEGVSKEEAAKLKEKLEAVGAKVEIK